ncbi:MAG: helix-turn-helix domain-containing protein [Rhizobiales bacterium]|nr:helix-turn-helix domain-containing protein [Hyphomicrobiales bacterium]
MSNEQDRLGAETRLRALSHGGDFDGRADEHDQPDWEDTLGGRIERARLASGLSQAQVARRLGVRSATMSAWESDRSEPRANRLVMLAGLLGVSPVWLISGHGDGPLPDGALADPRQFQASLESLRDQTAAIGRQIDRLLSRLQ